MPTSHAQVSPLPLHESAAWLAAFIYGYEPADEVLTALTRTGCGATRHVFNNASPLIDLLGYLRASGAAETDQALRLVAGGPGDPARLGPRAPSPAPELAARCGGALILGEDTADGYSLIIPEVDAHRSVVHWWALRGDEPLPPPDYLSPGEADYALAQATAGAAELIERAGFHSAPNVDPRLTVGELGDHLDSPGLPACLPVRATRLLARADRVAGLIERVIATAGDHRFDPELLALAAPIRRARIAAVDHAVRELARAC